MKALVLGASGHIGAHVVRALLAGGHEVRAAYRRESYLGVLEGLPVERARVDLATLEGLREALDGCGWVFHAAAPYPGFRDRVDHAVADSMAQLRRQLEVLRAARPARVVFTSSAAVIRRVPERPANEEDVEPWPSAQPRLAYATVKVALEHEILRACAEGLPAVIVNPSLCIGEHDAHLFSGQAVLVFAAGRVPVYIEHMFNAVYTGDVGAGQVLAAERGRIGERYLLTGRNLPVSEFARIVAAAAGVRPPWLQVPYRLALAAAWVSEQVGRATNTEALLPRELVYTARAGQRLDGSKAIRELGLPQTPIEEAVARAVRWFRAHGFL